MVEHLDQVSISALKQLGNAGASLASDLNHLDHAADGNWQSLPTMLDEVVRDWGRLEKALSNEKEHGDDLSLLLDRTLTHIHDVTQHCIGSEDTAVRAIAAKNLVVVNEAMGRLSGTNGEQTTPAVEAPDVLQLNIPLTVAARREIIDTICNSPISGTGVAAQQVDRMVNHAKAVAQAMMILEETDGKQDWITEGLVDLGILENRDGVACYAHKVQEGPMEYEAFNNLSLAKRADVFLETIIPRKKEGPAIADVPIQVLSDAWSEAKSENPDSPEKVLIERALDGTLYPGIRSTDLGGTEESLEEGL